MISVRNLSFEVGRFALHGVSLHIAAGEYFILLGPTGSGKTLFTECLCGLLRPASGSIVIDGRDVTRLAPRFRRIGYVPQNQGLFPHLDVRRNIEFALRVQHVPAEEFVDRVRPVVRLLGIDHLLERWPAHLSGGERQKVALARALVAEPRLLILDEPVSAVDEPSRDALCTELRRIQHELRIATLHVSHNIEEALSVGDRAGLFQEGRLIQVGPVAELLRRPATEFVARFFRSENLFRAEARPRPDGLAELRFAGHVVLCHGRLARPCSDRPAFGSGENPDTAGQASRGTGGEGPVTFVIRPESIEVHPSGAAVPNGIPAVLQRMTDRGPYRRLEFDAGMPVVVYATTESAGMAVGQPYVLAFPSGALHVLPQS